MPNPGSSNVWSLFYDLPVVQRLTYRPVHDAIIRVLRDRGTRNLLDLGCGTGLLSQRIVREFPAARLTGCDFSHGMLHRAAAHGPTTAWVRADAARLPFGDARFDTIVSSEAFHWFPDQPAALSECFRVLTPGGLLLVALVNPPIEPLSDVMYFGSRITGQPFYWPTRARMRALVEAAGFRCVAQSRLYRVPAGLLLPPVLTVASRPAACQA